MNALKQTFVMVMEIVSITCLAMPANVIVTTMERIARSTTNALLMQV